MGTLSQPTRVAHMTVLPVPRRPEPATVTQRCRRLTIDPAAPLGAPLGRAAGACKRPIATL